MARTAGGSWWRVLLEAVLAGVTAALRERGRRSTAAERPTSTDRRPSARTVRTRRTPSAGSGSGSGSRSGPRSGAGTRRNADEVSGLRIEYRPLADGEPDGGEVVWTWVPYEEDPSQGKDRPVLVLSRDGDQVLALMLTSKDHDRDAADEARHGRVWMDVGRGGWDRERRPSEVRLDRLLRLPAGDVRREGAALPRPTFDAVVRHLRELHGS